MADLNAMLGRKEAGLALANEAVEITRVSWPNSDMLATSLATLATCEVLNGLETASVGTLAEACQMVERAGTQRAGEYVLEAAVVVLARRKPALAARATGCLDAFDRRGERPRVQSPVTRDALAALERALGSRRFVVEREAGRATAVTDLLEEVRSTADATRRREDGLRVEFGSLTSREVDVLGLLARGQSDAEIGAELGMSAKTASVHVANIKGKLGARTRIEAAMRAQALLAAPPP
ncbi:MAG TPA: LuxR C-terminal-related transcriptional regulator [Candidatus Limnocylindrales bacterium]|jgi:DNA-binding CsgD family transcriptional regulator